jgi:hypothetical protein
VVTSQYGGGVAGQVTGCNFITTAEEDIVQIIREKTVFFSRLERSSKEFMSNSLHDIHGNRGND